LVFKEASGKNLTPDKLPRSEKAERFRNCDEALRKLIGVLKPEQVIGIGKFAGDRAKAAINNLKVRIGRVLHPSPASPIPNRGWADQAEKQLEDLEIGLPQ
jgi:single-strand selective monofunctional uracil DNA glycosylase